LTSQVGIVSQWILDGWL